jgi:non-ribosomal peptide synthetase component F
LFTWALLANTPLCAQPLTAPSAIDPTSWRTEIVGEPSRILNLGSAHLSQLDPRPPRGALEPLIERLVAFAPDIVTQEGVSGEQCDMMRQTPALYGGGLEYCWDAADIASVTGMDTATARTAIAASLADWPAQPTADQRRQLARLFIAAHDRTSALVQWWRLPEAERRATADFPQALVAIIVEQANGMNERNSIAAAVAARRGLERVFQVDDHSSDAILTAMPVACEAAITTMWRLPASQALQEREASRARGLTDGDAMMRYYRHLNAPETQRAYIDVDHRAAVGSGGAGDCGRRYVAWWETRNLRMAASIRAAMGDRPGARVLNVVGASHKPYYDLYLGQMADAVIVDAATVLGTP